MKSYALKRLLPCLPWILCSIRFNLHYFPFRVALKLPVLLMRPRFVHLGGSIQLDGRVHTGMVRIGHSTTSLFPRERVRLDLNGTIIFKGDCQISSGSVILTGKNSVLTFGNQVNLSDRSTLICFHRVDLGDYFNMSWECTLCDNDFHSLKRTDTGEKTIPYAPIQIGPYCWMGQRSTLLKGVTLPAYTTVQAQALVTRRIHCPERSIIGGNPARVLSEGKYFRDFRDDKPRYVNPSL